MPVSTLIIVFGSWILLLGLTIGLRGRGAEGGTEGGAEGSDPRGGEDGERP